MNTKPLILNMKKHRNSKGGKVEYTYQETSDLKWVRSREGWFAGVCQGLGESFNIDPLFLRIAWITSVFFFGFGFFVYLGLALTLPTRDQSSVETEKDRALGVCRRLHKKLGFEVGLIRFAFLVSIVSSFGITLLGYLILHFTLDED